MNRLAFGVVGAVFVLCISKFASAQDFRVIGAMKPLEAAVKLDQIGLRSQADQLRALSKNPDSLKELSALAFWRKEIQPWQHTNHVVAFIQAAQGESTAARPLTAATNITPDQTLKDQYIKITLDRLRVFAYPGGGVHNVLFDFYGQHQADEVAEDVHFSQFYRSQEGEGAGVAGYPIFVGLKLAKEGLKLRARTINVKNDDDEKLLSFIKSDAFKNGLQLINSTNPMTPVVTKFATGIFEVVGSRNRNVAVQDIDLGLDFSSISTRPKIAEGSYIAIQTPLQNWDWSKWSFYPDTGEVLSGDVDRKPIPFNYLIFSISRIQK